MKIGLLTLHSQLNYGGVLQCWALQTALESMGHEVVVIDRWLTPDNRHLDHGYNRRGRKWWLRFWLRSLIGLGDMRFWLRVLRTKKFIRKRLHLTPYHFHRWRDAPRDLGVDIIVVGSDQVWYSSDSRDPRPYLLDGAPDVPAIAYAASFGMTSLPPILHSADSDMDAEAIYRDGFDRFKSISCREKEGVAICAMLGFQSAHVVDPTLLIGEGIWRRIASTSRQSHRHSKKEVVCYFLSEKLSDVLPVLDDYSRRTKTTIRVFVNQEEKDGLPLLPTPTTFGKAKRWAVGLAKRHFRQIMVCDHAGPSEFLGAIANADAIVSDSFHALMFSIIFGRNVRILRPSSQARMGMFSRISEFAGHCDGPLIANGIGEALSSIESGKTITVDTEWLQQRRDQSLTFLQEALEIP